MYFQSSLAIALNMGHARDPETKEHLIRMGKYSEQIARTSIAQEETLHTNSFIEFGCTRPFLHDRKYRIPRGAHKKKRSYSVASASMKKKEPS